MASPASADTLVHSNIAVEDSAVFSKQSTAFNDQQSSDSFDRKETSSSSVSGKVVASRSLPPLDEESQEDVALETIEDTVKISTVYDYEAPSQSAKSNLPPWLRTQAVIANAAPIGAAVVNVPNQLIPNQVHDSSETSTTVATPPRIPQQRARHEHMFASPHPQVEDLDSASVASVRRLNANPIVVATVQGISDPTSHLFLPVMTQSQLPVTIGGPLAPISQPTSSLSRVESSPVQSSAVQRPVLTHGSGTLSGTVPTEIFQHFGSEG